MTPSPPRVHILKQGTVQGSLDSKKGVAKFLNIPFGTVKERWRPAVKPEPWTGIRDATKQGPVPPQPKGESRFSRAINAYSGFDFDDETTVFSERDCLNLNIYVHQSTLEQATASDLEGQEDVEVADRAGQQSGEGAKQGAAVMVYIYGGGFRDGSNAMELYDGTNLVAESVKLGKPVIVVTINYRLGFLGFFSCPALVNDLQNDPSLSSAYEKSAGNWGLQDQRLAFEWIRQKISLWGGQADNITAFGQSVGAVSVNYHMLIKEHRGLFERGIMQSCAMASAPAVRPEVEGQLYLDYLVDHFQIPKNLSDKEKIERLKQVSDVELGWAADSPRLRMSTPYVDGYMVPEDVRLWVHKTEEYDHGVKAVMIGDMKDDGLMFIGSLAATTREGWPRIYEKYCPPTKEGGCAWSKVFGAVESDEDAAKESNKVVEHTLFTYPEYSTLRALSKRRDLDSSTTNEAEGKFELFQYYFDRPIAEVEERRKLGWGAHHGVDLVFLFAPDLAMDSLFSDQEKQLSKAMQSIWIHFAHGETQGRINKITRPVGDFEYHGHAKEAVVFAEDCTVQKEHVSRHGRDVFELWEMSEQWVHASRREGGMQGLRAGLLCIAQPGESTWS